MSVSCAPADRHVDAPRFRPAAGGWDSHAHVFGPVAEFPYAGGRKYTPPEQTVIDYVALLDALGLQYGVLVQPSVYGTDNACMIDAMRRAPGRLRAVVDLDLEAVSDSTLASMRDAGCRGVRQWIGPATPPDLLVDIAGRIRSLGWHLDLYFTDAALLSRMLPTMAGLNLPVVVEAMGSIRCPAAIGGEAFTALKAMLDTGHVWVKLSHPYQLDMAGPPYRDVASLARALVSLSPERMIWGSDWPHPMVQNGMPNDGMLLDLLLDWAGGEEVANRILVDNPPLLYL